MCHSLENFLLWKFLKRYSKMWLGLVSFTVPDLINITEFNKKKKLEMTATDHMGKIYSWGLWNLNCDHSIFTMSQKALKCFI